MTWRIIWRIVSRSAHFGFAGFFWMLLIGLVEGVVTGGLLGIVMGVSSALSGGGGVEVVFMECCLEPLSQCVWQRPPALSR
jgi:hypothetical protein